MRLGPLDLSEATRMPVTPATPVWRDGLPDWTTCGALPEFGSLFNVAPVVPTPRPMPEVAEPEPEVEPVEPCEPEAEAEYPEAEAVEPEPAYQQPYEPAYQQPYEPAYGMPMQPQQQPATSEMGECPPSHLVWSVIATVLCCLPLGALGIYFSAQVSSAWQRGDATKARKMSERAEWCIMLAITLGLALSPVQMVIGML